MVRRTMNAVVCRSLLPLVLTLFSLGWSSSDDSLVPAPTTTLAATRGLTETPSAEPMGAGRLSFSILGTWYKQAMALPNVADGTPGVMTEITAVSFGVNPYIDLFGSISGYGQMNESLKGGLGSVEVGIQGSLPLPKASPFFFGLQMGIIGGTSQNQLNTNRADGYDYFETRTGNDVFGQFLESLVFGSEKAGIKFLLHEGAAINLESSSNRLLLLGAGIEGIPHEMIVLGIEFNSRTLLNDLTLKTDPLWISPSIQFRTPYYFNVVLGGDISLSNDRALDSATRAIEPYRIYGGFVFSFDLLASKRAAAREKERKEAAEKVEAEQKIHDAQARADSVAVKAKADSLAQVRTRQSEREAEEQRVASLMQKAQEDSMALAETKKKLAEERSKRSDAEKQLLSTGLLLLDAVYFESGKSEISINSLPYLNIIGKMLTKYPKLQIEVSGHTDNTGSLPLNVSLSQARADAVRAYMIQIAPDLSMRCTARGYGPTQPKADNLTADGRKNNRRVELQVLNKEALQEYK